MERFRTNWHLDAHFITRAWTEESMTDAQALTMFNSRGISIESQTGLTGGNTANINARTAVRDWMQGFDGGRSNPFGFMLSVRGDTTLGDHGLINSRNHGTANNRPRLVVDYVSAGSAWAFNPSIATPRPNWHVNCYLYAINVRTRPNPQDDGLDHRVTWGSTLSASLNNVRDVILTDTRFRDIRVISGPTAELPNDNYYRLALRVGRHPSEGWWDYHY